MKCQMPPSDDYSRSGVYFLHAGNEIVYVGQAHDMRRRIGQHMAEGIKIFDAATCIGCDPALLDRMERRFIRLLVPTYNNCSVAAQSRMFLSAGFNPWQASAGDGPDDDLMLSSDQAASFLGVELDYLETLRRGGLAAKTRRRGRNREVVATYRPEDLVAYVKSNSPPSTLSRRIPLGRDGGSCCPAVDIH